MNEHESVLKLGRRCAERDALVRRSDGASTLKLGRRCAEVGRGVHGLDGGGTLKLGRRGGAVGVGDGWVRAVCSLEGIGIYQSQSELIGGYRIFSDKL